MYKGIRFILSTIISLIFFTVLGISNCEAAQFDWVTNMRSPSGVLGEPLQATCLIEGFNQSQGITMALPYTINAYYRPFGSSYTYYDINYTVPDDGCTWQIKGFFYMWDPDSWTPSYSTTLSTIVSTSGSFTGVSPKTATDAANTAATNATNAANAANAANTNASSALTSVNYIKNSMLSVSGGIVQDSSGTVLTAARNAYNAANQVSSKVDSLQNSVNNMQTTVNNINNNISADTIPPNISLSTLSGAMATSGSSIQIVVDASDNVSTAFTYSLNGSSYLPLPSNGVISVPVTSSGPNLIDVWIKDQAGNAAKKSITIRKL